MLKDRRTYEIMRPEDVGVPATTLVLGKHSGRHALQHRLASLGVEVTRLELDRLYRRMIALADAQKTVSDPELLQLVELQRTNAHADPHVVVGGQPRHNTAQEEVGYGHGV
jgi:2-isopropylmalate synthase